MGYFEEFAGILEVSGVEADLGYEGVESDQMLALDILAAHMVVQVSFFTLANLLT